MRLSILRGPCFACPSLARRAIIYSTFLQTSFVICYNLTLVANVPLQLELKGLHSRCTSYSPISITRLTTIISNSIFTTAQAMSDIIDLKNLIATLQTEVGGLRSDLQHLRNEVCQNRGISHADWLFQFVEHNSFLDLNRKKRAHRY